MQFDFSQRHELREDWHVDRFLATREQKCQFQSSPLMAQCGHMVFPVVISLLNYTAGRILDIGRFLALAPETMQNATCKALEYESVQGISALIAVVASG